MKVNVGPLGSVLRVTFGIALLLTYFMGAMEGAFSIVVLVLGLILIVTGMIGYCPIFDLLKMKHKGEELPEAEIVEEVVQEPIQPAKQAVEPEKKKKPSKTNKKKKSRRSKKSKSKRKK